MGHTRRGLLAGLGMVGLGAMVPSLIQKAGASPAVDTDRAACPFRLAVINDEISQDFERACAIVAQDFGLGWIELRGMWDKNLTELSPAQIEDARKILEKYKLRVTDIASPLFKTDWPGAPRSPQSDHRDQFHADFDAAAQDKLLEHCLSLAKTFQTDRIRCFDYWRLDDPKPFRAAINARLAKAADRCAREHVILLLENEMTCNTATGGSGGAPCHPQSQLHAELGPRQRGGA
jgi:L-ribulose-5-phosphate 3-epimerase